MPTHRHLASLALALLVAPLLAPPAAAVVVEQLHEVEVAVADQSPDARTKAFKVALAEVVVRLTGDARAPVAPELAALMRTPQRFVAEFAYITIGAEPGTPTMATGPKVAPTLRLAVRFEGLALQQALREAGRAVMGRERPRTLMWLALDEGADRGLVGVDDADSFVAAAAARGLPLAFPALDETDMAAIDAGAVVAQDEVKLAAASARPGHDGLPPEAWLGAEVWRASRAWQGRFVLGISLDSSVQRFEAKAPTLDALAAQAMDQVAAAIAQRYAVAGTELLAIDFAVEGVDGLGKYAAVTDLLEHMSIVRRVEVVGLQKDLLELRVAFIGGAAALERAIALDPRFGRSLEAARDGGLRYRFVP